MNDWRLSIGRLPAAPEHRSDRDFACRPPTTDLRPLFQSAVGSRQSAIGNRQSEAGAPPTPLVPCFALRFYRLTRTAELTSLIKFRPPKPGFSATFWHPFASFWHYFGSFWQEFGTFLSESGTHFLAAEEVPFDHFLATGEVLFDHRAGYPFYFQQSFFPRLFGCIHHRQSVPVALRPPS